MKDRVKFLLDDIQDADKVEILKDDDGSLLFQVTFKDGTSRRGIYYESTLCLPVQWELEDE